MTPDELVAAVLGGDAGRVVGLLASASEADRRACGARMQTLRRTHGDWRSFSRDQARNETTLLALLGTGTAAQIEAGRRMWLHDQAATVLRLRPTELLVELVPWMLDRFSWPFVRAMVRDGTIPRPASDAYIYGMLVHHLDAATLVRVDPDLLEHEVWRLFEVEGTGDHSLADHDKYTPDEKTWSRVLRDLAGDLLDRDRLLEASLSALERDFPAFRAGWYSRFHEALSPSPGERAARVDAYLRLLRSPIGPTVSLAVGALTEAQRAGGLDGAKLLEHVEPAVTARAAGTARDALRLVERAVREVPALAPAAFRVAVAALSQGSADVQRAALTMLETMPAPIDPAGEALLAARRGDVAASLRSRLNALLSGPVAMMPEPAGASPSSRPRALPAAPASPAAPEPAPEPDPGRLDPFDLLVPLASVGSLPDLVELLAQVLEREGPPEDLELALDGVLRFGGPRPADFERVTKAIRVRSGRLLEARRSRGIATWFASLVRAWVDGTPPEEELAEAATLAGYLAGRVAEVAHLVVRGRSGGLLALPSYAGGWIEPAVFVERVAARQLPPGPADGEALLDLVQALLRLLPRRRDEALVAAGALRGEVGDAVRHALGGPSRVGPTAALWAAAARCRAPDDDDPEVARVHPGLGADAAVAGRYTLVIGQGRFVREPQLDGGVPAGAARSDLPTDLLSRVSAQRAGPSDERPLVDWMRLIWPQSRRSWFAGSAAMLLDNLDWWEARWSNRQRLEALFEPWTAVDREGAMLLAIALQAKEPGERGLAVDGLAAALDEGRLTPEVLIRGFDEVAAALEPQPASKYPVTLFRPGRLAQSLDAVAGRSHRHAEAALLIAAGALARIVVTERPVPVPVGQITPLLRLLVELTAVVPAGVPPIAGPALERLVAGSGETARLSRQLRDAACSPSEQPRT